MPSRNRDWADDPAGDSADDPAGDSADDPAGDSADDPAGDSAGGTDGAMTGASDGPRDAARLPDSYDDLLERYSRLQYLRDAGGVLRWDQQVMMPEEGTPARSKQLSALSAVQHDLLTADEFAETLSVVRDADLPAPEAAVVREIDREYERAAAVPTDLVERISRETSEALPVWEEARAESDFAAFAPKLRTLLDLKREYADHIDPDADPYAVLFADYEPYLDLSTAERILDRLRTELGELVEEIGQSDADLATDAFAGEYPADGQEELCRAALDVLGYPWERGRLDTAPHPFSTGTPFDARVTTRFDESDVLGSLTSTIHEFGHATYTLGLPEDQYGTPLGDDRGLTVHESQSRLWENHVGRSRAFWDLFLPRVRDRFPACEDVTVEAAYEAANQVYDDNPIRVQADELTYHMHVVLRFEIERELVSGDLDVAEVPSVWNDRMDEYLGVRPADDAEGCLQDIHWSHGSFGYFPTYTLGSVLAAQLFTTAADDIPDLDDRLRAGEFGPLHEWLTENVHAHGQRHTTDELIEAATGEPLTADYFLEYVTEKFGDLYELDGS